MIEMGSLDPIDQKRQRLLAGGKARVLDICAGAGGFSLGFKKVGFELIGAIENDPIAIATYAANLHRSEGVDVQGRLSKPHDLVKTTPAGIAKALKLGPVAGSVDVLLAGLPCQAFARIGRPKLGSLSEDPIAYKTDPRAGLYRRFLKFVRAMKPLCVVVENVPDILNHGGHNIPEEISRSLEKSGYVCRYTLLNAACYGVPQLRERLFLVAYHHSVGATPTFPSATHWVDFPPGYTGVRLFALKHVDSDASHYISTSHQLGHLPATTVEQALRDLPAICRRKWSRKSAPPSRKITNTASYMEAASEYGLTMRAWPGFTTGNEVTAHVVRHTPRDYQHFGTMRSGEQYPEMHRRAVNKFNRLVARLRKAGKGFKANTKKWQSTKASIVPPYDPGKFPNKWRKLEPNKPACTLTAHLGKDTYSHIHHDGNQARTISVREAARLQSFPDGFVFCGAMNSAFKQIGNAVPPLLAAALAAEIARTLQSMVDRDRFSYKIAAE